MLDYHGISCHYIYGSNAVKVFTLSYSPEDINYRNYTYDFNITVDNW